MSNDAILAVTLYEGPIGNDGHYKDQVSLKVESIAPIQVQRAPIIIPLPGGTIVGIDLGRNNAVLNISGTVDTYVKQLFLYSSSNLHVGETITGDGAINDYVNPVRTAAPTATITGIVGNPADPEAIMVTGLDPAEFFIDWEEFTGNMGGSGIIKCPLPSKRRLEQIARYWYTSGILTVRIGDPLNFGTNPSLVIYQGYITDMNFTMLAGLEDRYTYRMSFAEAQQSFQTMDPIPNGGGTCPDCFYYNAYHGACETCDLNGDGHVDILDFTIAKLRLINHEWNSYQFNLYDEAWTACVFGP